MKTNVNEYTEGGEEGEKILIPRLWQHKCPEPISRRVPSVTTIFPVSMRLAAGTRQIAREQREITIWWRVFAIRPLAICHGILYLRKHLLE